MRHLRAGALAALGVILPASAFANNIGINGGPCTFNTLAAAVAAAVAGDTLFLRPTNYNPPTLNINKNLTIASSNANCSAATSRQVWIRPSAGARVFDVTGAAVLTLSGVKLGGANSFEALIYAAPGTGVFPLNTLIDDGHSDTDGGCVHLDDAVLWMIDSDVQDCSADGLGGAIYAGSGSIIASNDTTLQRNSAGSHGGAIYLDEGEVILDSGTWITENSATDFGGGLYLLDSEGTLSDAEVTFNDAEAGAGLFAMSPTSAPLLTIKDGTRFEGNAAVVDGGAIRGLDASITLGDVQIVNNSAGDWGGGLALLDVVFNAEATTADGILISGNTAPNGAGMEIALSPGTFSGVLLTDNIATGDGGGMLIEFGATIDLENTRFVRNSAARGGGAFVSESTVDMDANFTSCTPAALPIEAYCSEFVLNTSTGNGGAVLVRDGSTVEIEQTSFKANQANAKGGSLHMNDAASSATLRNALVVQDTTPVEAAVTAAAGVLNVFSTTFADNGASVEYEPAATGEFARSIVWNNAVGEVFGAAIGNCNITQTAAPAGTKNVQSDPLFDAADPRSQYRLQNGSPAIDACSTGPNQDIDGTARILGLGYDRGAFEDS